MVKNLPCNPGDMGSIPDWGTTIPHVAGQLSSHTTAREAGTTMKIPHAVTKPNRQTHTHTHTHSLKEIPLYMNFYGSKF